MVQLDKARSEKLSISLQNNEDSENKILIFIKYSHVMNRRIFNYFVKKIGRIFDVLAFIY